MKIGHDHSGELQYKIKLKRKKSSLSSALKLCTKFVDIEDQKMFEQNMSSYVIKALSKKIGLPYLDEKKIIELTDLPITKIRTLQRNFQSVDVDLEKTITDFGIYSTNEKQVTRYKDLQSLCDMLNKFNPGEWMWIQRAFQEKVIQRDSIWIPNYHLIVSIV